MEKLLNIAKMICVAAHKDQTTRDGAPYCYHPITVAEIADPMNKFPKLRMVCLLHDVIEDTHWTDVMLLEAGIPDDVVEGVIAITKIDGELYGDYIIRVMNNILATLAKIADMTHNMDMERLPYIRVKDVIRNRKYRNFRNMLKSYINTMELEHL